MTREQKMREANMAEARRVITRRDPSSTTQQIMAADWEAVCARRQSDEAEQAAQVAA